MSKAEIQDAIREAVTEAFAAQHCPLGQMALTPDDARELVTVARASRAARKIGWTVAITAIATFLVGALAAGVVLAIRGRPLPP